MVVDQLGTILTGAAPLEYVKDIRTTIIYILNVLVTRQRPRILLKRPEYKKARAKVMELGHQMIKDAKARYATTRPEDRNLIDDIMAAHIETPEKMPESDLIVSLTGPYVAGLDTVANTTSAAVYCVLKHPEVKARVLKEVDDLFAAGDLDEEGLLRKLPALNGAIMETMRLYPIAVAQMRTASRDFVFEGHQIHAGEMIYVGTSVPHFMEEYWPNVQDLRHRPLSEATRRASAAWCLLTLRSRPAHLPRARASPKCRWHCRWPGCSTSSIWNWNRPTTCSRPRPRPRRVRR